MHVANNSTNFVFKKLSKMAISLSYLTSFKRRDSSNPYEKATMSTFVEISASTFKLNLLGAIRCTNEQF